MNRIFPQGRSPRPRRALRVVLVIAGVAMGAGSIAAMTVSAAPGEDVIGAQRGQIRMLESEVQRIDAQAAAAADAHAAAVRRADDLRARISETTASLVEARAARSVALRRLSDRIVGLYAQHPPSLIEIVLTSGGLTAAVDTQQALEAVGEQDRLIVQQIEATKARLTALRADLEGDRAAVEASVTASAARLDDLQGLIGRRRAVLDDAQSALDRLVARDASRRATAAAAARAAAAEAAAERDLLRRADPTAAGPASAVAATPTAESVAAPAAAGGGVSAALERIAQCESGGNPQAVSGSGQYRGKYQFDLGTWQSLGGSGDPAAAPEAEQDRIAAILYARSGPAPWPICGYR